MPLAGSMPYMHAPRIQLFWPWLSPRIFYGGRRVVRVIGKTGIGGENELAEREDDANDKQTHFMPHSYFSEQIAC